MQYFHGFQIPIQYIPLHTIWEGFTGLAEYRASDFIPMSEYWRVFLTQIGGNLILLIPMGMALPYIFHSIKNYKSAAKIGFFISLGIETLQ